ncbi:uncharacterized protein LY89DRAFT_87973 [Mollisia scopiformis]|uniref:Uncharacterized protein n=1 Tax=Mollisia scopiformis TaxID=149040 RepID=A0A194X908_MOLSC|nr:uncharacterized protein LY89DRAFT_87973 [Mollisia scopiformis]KUJ16599.1 hypothetical protein LY89DRAFT_87973 [Mollisia scopiformis]
MAWIVFLSFQSNDIIFSDWVTLLTLCLAPLIAHIAAGVPPPIYLHSNRPSWHDRICHYNPTSILWRYLAIADRRLRAKSWNTLDLAATNAIFWDGHKWDGSEDMIQRSRDFCIRGPSHHHIDPLSMSTIVTLVVTLQGVQALYSLVHGTQGLYAYTVALNTIFFPLATLGLLRLPAALWLTTDYAYRHNEDWESDTPEMGLHPNLGVRSNSALVRPTTNSLDAPIVPNRFRSHRGWLSIAVRGFYLIMITGLLVLCIYMLTAPVGTGDAEFSATNLTLNLTFLFFLAFSTGTIGAYILLGRCKTTIIPCITATWYKIYTGILFAAMFTVFIIACLETRRTPCGRFTTYPKTIANDWGVCGESTYAEIAAEHDTTSSLPVSRTNGTQLSYAAIYFNSTYGIAMNAGEDEIVVIAIDGWCKIDSEITLADISMFKPTNFSLTA